MAGRRALVMGGRKLLGQPPVPRWANRSRSYLGRSRGLFSRISAGRRQERQTTESILQDFDQRLADSGRRGGHPDAGCLQRGDLGGGVALAAGDDGAGPSPARVVWWTAS